MASTGVKCDDCGATNSESARFCAECGESLDIGAPHSSKERKRRAKGEASVELKRARKVIRVVRLSFGFNIVLYALYLLFVYQGLMGVDLGSLELPVWILLAVVTCMLALSVVAFIRVKLHPFTWAILLASLSTAERIFQIFTDGALYISIAWTIGLWLLVPATAKVRRIMRSTPDHYGVQAMQGTTREARNLKRSKGRLSAGDAKNLARLAQRRMMFQSCLAVVIVFGISGILAGIVKASIPDSPEVVLAAFTEEWNSGDNASLTRRFRAAPGDTIKGRWNRLAEGPLAQSLPTLTDPTKTEYGLGRVETWWDTPQGEVALSMVLRDSDWTITGFKPPVPPIEERASKLRSAWNSGQQQRITSMYQESSRAKSARSFERMLERQDWTDDSGNFSLPQLGPPRLVKAGIERLVHSYDSDFGAFRATFRIVEGGDWALTSLQLPRSD